jgi:hypothetical protein
MSNDQGTTGTIETANTPSQGASTGTRRGGFHDRLNEAAGEVSYRKLGRLTDTHPETVRRYMQGQAPSATFMTNLCRVLGISGEWLLTGRGPMKCSDMRSHALSQADPSELLTAVANTMTDLCDRMDRLERFVQSIETRLNGGITQSQTHQSGRPKAEKLNRTREPKAIAPSGSMNTGGEIICDEHPVTKPESSVKRNGTSVQRIRDAIAKRSS